MSTASNTMALIEQMLGLWLKHGETSVERFEEDPRVYGDEDEYQSLVTEIQSFGVSFQFGSRSNRSSGSA